MLFHHRGQFAGTSDLVGGSPGQQFLPDEGQFVPFQVLKGEFLPKTEGAAIHEKNVGAGLVLDREIIAPRPEFLF